LTVHSDAEFLPDAIVPSLASSSMCVQYAQLHNQLQLSRILGEPNTVTVTSVRPINADRTSGKLSFPLSPQQHPPANEAYYTGLRSNPALCSHGLRPTCDECYRRQRLLLASIGARTGDPKCNSSDRRLMPGPRSSKDGGVLVIQSCAEHAPRPGRGGETSTVLKRLLA
jgi:hypothetical protein